MQMKCNFAAVVPSDPASNETVGLFGIAKGTTMKCRDDSTIQSQSQAIGSGRRFLAVMNQIREVAPTDSPVLIEGETGAGKEVLAAAIHQQSAHRSGPFIKVNCAAISSQLLQSELFGHEKGAFAAAVAPRIGQLETAARGTLFLDEIADMPLELQPRLLRVLEQREFERMGGSRTLRVEARIVAATSCDLAALVKSGRFRADLYNRLAATRIQLPPLRQRADDIPELAYHFVNRHARKLNKVIDTIPTEVMEVLKLHHWPGNVRELESFIERAVIMSPGPILRPPLADLRHLLKPISSVAGGTLAESERDHILAVLEDTGWMIGGYSGAAARLGLARSALVYTMQKLGIAPRRPARSARRVAMIPGPAIADRQKLIA
jgi:formate hydrogenlyase transcriptional activator